MRQDGVSIPISGRRGTKSRLHIGERYLNLHFNVCGNPGMGKSTVMMHLLAEVERRGEVAIVLGDPKAEYFGHFYRPGRGDWVIDPASEDGCYWALEREALDRASAETWGLSFIPDPPGADHQFFPQNARAALSGLLAAHHEAKNPSDPASCENLARMLGADELSLMKRLVGIPGTRAFNPKAPNQLAGLSGTLAPLAPSFAAMPRKYEDRREFTVQDWAAKRDGSWIFFTSTPDTRDASRPVQTAIADNLLRALERVVPGAVRVWVICDELSLMKRMSSLIESAAMQRASGNPLVFGFQNSAQIEMLYGRAGMMALLGMAYTQIAFASTDPGIQKHIEEQCGYEEVERVGENMPAHVMVGSKHSRSSSLSSQQSAHEAVVMATQIGGLPPYQFVVKQRDMVFPARIARFERRPLCCYRRRLIPDMVLPLANDEIIPLDKEEEIPVDPDEAPIPLDEETPWTKLSARKESKQVGGRPKKSAAKSQPVFIRPNERKEDERDVEE